MSLQACIAFNVHPGKSCTFQLETATMDLTFSTDTDNELFQWFTKLREAIMQSQTLARSQDILAGQMVKKGQVRYVVLRQDRLAWYLTREVKILFYLFCFIFFKIFFFSL